MKYLKQITTVVLLTFIFTSCGNETKKDTTEVEKATQTVENAKNVSKNASAMQKNIEELQKKEHLTKAQWESWLPEMVLDMPLKTPQINFLPGLGSCASSYAIGNKKIRVMVIDGAGEKGAGGVGSYRMSSKMDYDTEDQWGYTKTVVIDGLKAKKSYVKTSGMYNLSMFYANRFAVDIETHNFTEDMLEQIVEELHLGELKNL